MIRDNSNAVGDIAWQDIVRMGLVYFGLVFGVGFSLGTLRILLFVPMVGERLAEIGETPLMLLAVYFVARWIVRRFRIPPRRWCRIQVGFTGLVLLLLAEWGVVMFVRNESIGEYIAGRDPVAGAVYLVSLALFALMPALIRGVADPGDDSARKNGRAVR